MSTHTNGDVIRMLGSLPESMRTNNFVVRGGTAVELSVGPTGCRPTVKDLDLGLSLEIGSNTAWEFFDAELDRIQRERYRYRDYPLEANARAIIERFGPGYRLNRPSSIHDEKITGWTAGELEIDFINRRVLPRGDFDAFSTVRRFTAVDSEGVQQTGTFRVEDPMSIVISKLRSGRYRDFNETSIPALQPKATQDLIDIAILLDRTPSVRRVAQLNHVVLADPEAEAIPKEIRRGIDEIDKFATYLTDHPDTLRKHVETRGGTMADFVTPDWNNAQTVLRDLAGRLEPVQQEFSQL